MKLNRVWIRALLGFTLVAACLAAAIAPALSMVQAAPPQASAAPGSLVISSVRFAGNAGPTDEYIEIFNRGTGPADLGNYEIRAADGSSTWADPVYTFPAGTSLPSGAYYLVTGPTYNDPTPPGGFTPVASAPYTLSPLPSSDGLSVKSGSVALFSSASASTPVDAVGFGGAGGGYFEGTALAAPRGTTDQGFFRKTYSNQYIDSNDNAADFAAKDPTGTPGIGLPTVTISGTTGSANATITWTGMTEISGVTTAPTSSATGAYSISVPVNWSGVVTVSKPGYSFSVSSGGSNSFTHVTANKTLNFTAKASTATSTFQADVVINEVGWSGTIGNSSNDWIELYNNTASAIDFSTGWRLTSPSGMVINLTGTIAAGGYYIIAHTGTASFATTAPTLAATPACQIFKLQDYSNAAPPIPVPQFQYFTGSLSSYGQILFLYNNGGSLEDYANLNGGAWPAGSISLSRSMERHAQNLPDSDTNWYTYYGTPKIHDCQGNLVYGSPGYANWAGGVTATPSPTPTKYRTPTPPVPTPYGHMVINEFLPRAGYDWNQDGKVDVYDEFVELYNLGPVNANLNGWRIDVISPGGKSSYSLSGLTFKPGDRMVFYRLKTNVELPDMGGTVRLINSRGVIIDARGYDPVQAPDQSICRIPDGQYWRFPCFPTPGLQNSLTGTHPVPPPAIAPLPPPCVMSDIIPAPFRDAECYPFGADVFNPAYWDDQAGFRKFPVPDHYNKWRAVVE